MLHTGAKSRPEATRGHNLAIGSTAVVIGANSSASGHIALSHHTGGDEERVVVMLLVRGEDEVVQHLAARDGGVVAHHGMDETSSIFQVTVVAQDESGGHHGIEDAASVTRYAIHQNDAFANLRRFLFRRVDGYVLQFARTFNITMWPHFGIFQNPAVLDDA